MTKTLSLPLLLAIGALTANAAEPLKFAPYANASAVVGFMGEFRTAAGFSAAAGTTINGNHAVDFEVVSINTSRSGGGGDLDVLPLLLNYKYRADLTRNLSGYVGASVGVTSEKAKGYGYSESTSTFTVGAKVGAEWNFASHLALDVSGTVLHLNESNVTTAGSIEYVAVGLRYSF